MKREDGEDHRRLAQKWIEGIIKGKGPELEVLSVQGLELQIIEKGLVRCYFTAPPHLSDRDGNWHVGAMSILIDNIGAITAVSSFGNTVKASVDCNFSFFSTAKIHEEVEIEGKVAGSRERLVSIMVEVKKKHTGELIALGRQWMALKLNSNL